MSSKQDVALAAASGSPSAGMSRRTFVRSLAAAPLISPFPVGAGARTEDAPRERIRHESEHVVVVGAGAFGGWSALMLLRAGMRVTLVDAWGAGHARASSGGETRVIRAVYGGVPRYTEMVARALTLWRDAERQWSRQLLFPTGTLWMCAADDAFVRRSIEPMRSVGLPLEEMSLDEARSRFRQFNFRGVRTAFFEPDSGYISARAACELVRQSFVQEGGTYRQAWVRPGATASRRLSNVALSSGDVVEADRFVFACGPWMGQVFPAVIGRRIVATRQEVFFFGTRAGDSRYDFGSLPVWVHLGARITYGVPAHDGRGLKVADDTAGVEIDPTTMERAPSRSGLANARAILRERFPAIVGAPLVEARTCQYELSSDSHFLVDRHPEIDNVWLVGGGSGHGFKMGPAIGEHVAALVQGRETVHPLFAYARLRPRPPTRS
jgi:sarcosine oxidase